MPRCNWPFSGASMRASSSNPAVPEALSSAPGCSCPICEGARESKVTAAEMIVMRTENHIFVGFAGEIGQDVVHFCVGGLNIDRERGVHGIGKAKDAGLRGGIDLILHVFQRFASGLKPAFRDCIFHLSKNNPSILRAVHAAEAGEKVFFAIAKFAVEKDEALSAMIARVDRLSDKLRVSGKALIATFCREAAGFKAKNNDNFVLHIQAGVIVVGKLLGGGAISGKNQGSEKQCRKQKS